MKAEVIFNIGKKKDGEIRESIIKYINTSKVSIKVAVAWLTDEDIIRLLANKSQAGLEVKVIISNCKENFRSTGKFKELISYGKLYISNNPFLHHKFCVLDDRIVINGSYNWSYPARHNEENIVVMTVEPNVKDDADFLKRFNVRHTFLCEKRSMLITNMQTLNLYKETSMDFSAIIPQLDYSEIQLRSDFENDVKHSFDQSREAKIPIGHLLLERMKSDGGGVEFVKRILHDEMTSGDMKSGFKELENVIPHRVDLSLEYLVSRAKYHNLFTVEEVQFCIRLMQKYNLSTS